MTKVVSLERAFNSLELIRWQHMPILNLLQLQVTKWPDVSFFGEILISGNDFLRNG